MDHNVEQYIEDLRRQREDVEDRLRDRENKRRESNEIFLGSVKKELEYLEKTRDTYELRNKKFLEDSRGIVEDYKAELAKAYQADQALNVHKRRLEKFIQKNYPRIVSQLKARLFQDHQDVSKRLREMREGGSGVIRLNSEIRNLSEEINAKRSELFEQEEQRLRNQGGLRHFQYKSNPYSQPYDRNVSHDASRGREDVSTNKERGERVSSYDNYEEQKRMTVNSVGDERPKQSSGKTVSFTQSGSAGGGLQGNFSKSSLHVPK